MTEDMPSSLDRPANAPPLLELMRELAGGQMDLDEAPAEAVEAIAKMTRRSPAELRRFFESRKRREARSPKPGLQAPDFELELLGPDGQRSGTHRRLSHHRGRPVALVFGSYT